MRIISQDGERNVPYESGIVHTELTSLGYGIYWQNGNLKCRLATYNTEERTIEVMEEIKEKGHFLGTGNNWYQMPEDREKENEEN